MIKLSKKTENGTTYIRARRKIDGRWTVDKKKKINGLSKKNVNELQPIADRLLISKESNQPLEPLWQKKVDNLEGVWVDLFNEVGILKTVDKKAYSVRKLLWDCIKEDQLKADDDYLVQSTVDRRKRIVVSFLEFVYAQHKTKDYDVRKIDKQFCDNFVKFKIHEKKHSDKFVSAEIKWIRGYFKRILLNGLIKTNPFVDVIVPSKGGDDDRRVFIPSELLDRVTEWLKENKEYSWYPYWLLVRYTGCRRAEALQLKWDHIDFELERIEMPSPKTRRKGKTSRLMPIYEKSPLLEMLKDLFEYQGEPKTGYVVRDILRLHDTDRENVKWDKKNPTTSLEWFVIESGVAPWPKLLQNLRVTRENELLQSGDYRPLAIHRFIGHTPKTFNSNYAQLNDNDFKPRSQREKRPAKLLKNEFDLLYSPNYVPKISRKSRSILEIRSNNNKLNHESP